MAFHRLTVPSYFGGLPGGYDYINNAVSGTPALFDTAKVGGPMAGTYFVAFGEDAVHYNVNRPAHALAENCDYLDDLLRRDLASPTKTNDVVAGAPVTSIVLTGPGIFCGDVGTPNSVAGIKTFVRVLDDSDQPIMNGMSECEVTATSPIPGTGFSPGNVTLTISPAIPGGTTYRVYYFVRGNLATFPVDVLPKTATWGGAGGGGGGGATPGGVQDDLQKNDGLGGLAALGAWLSPSYGRVQARRGMTAGVFGPSLDITNATKTIHRYGGSWISDGFAAGDLFSMLRGDGDGFWDYAHANSINAVPIVSVTASDIVLDNSVTLSDEVALDSGTTLCWTNSYITHGTVTPHPIDGLIRATVTDWKPTRVVTVNRPSDNHLIDALTITRVGGGNVAIGIGGNPDQNLLATGVTDRPEYIGLWSDQFWLGAEVQRWGYQPDAHVLVEWVDQINTADTNPHQIPNALALAFGGANDMWVRARKISGGTEQAEWAYCRGELVFYKATAGAAGWTLTNTGVFTADTANQVTVLARGASGIFASNGLQGMDFIPGYRNLAGVPSFKHPSGNITVIPDVNGTLPSAGGGPSARVYNSSQTNVNDSTFTILPWNSEVWDTGGLHDTVTNNERLTAVVAGKYQVTVNLAISAAGTPPASNERREVRIIKNAGGANSMLGCVISYPLESADTMVNLTALCDLAANDYVRVEVFQNSGGALAFGYGDQETAHFSMVRVEV